MLEVSVPVVLINGMEASADQLARPALVNDGHFTAMQVRSGRARGLRVPPGTAMQCTPRVVRHGARCGLSTGGDAARRRVAPGRIAAGQFYESQPGLPQVVTAIRAPVEAAERAQLLLPVDYSRPFAHIKHVGSFAQIRYGIEANKVGYDDAVLVTSDGRICESTVANIGFLERDTVVWPEAPALYGVTWQLLDQVLGQRGIEVRRRPVSLESAAGFAGAFLANSIGVVPVARIGQHDYQPDNDTFPRIRRAYDEVAWDEI